MQAWDVQHAAPNGPSVGTLRIKNIVEKNADISYVN